MDIINSNRNFWAIAAIAISCSLQGALGWAEARSDLVKVSGTVTGFSGIETDNIVDGAIVLPSLSADDLFKFNVDEFMGPNENMTVGGLFKAEVPSNFYFPQQKERWGIFPVSFGKESFSSMVVPGAKKELMAAWFQLPFDKMVEIGNNHLPSTAMLPFLSIKKHGYLAAKDWSTVSKISIPLDKELGPKVKFSWDKSTGSGNDMDGVFLFQATSTARWVFANLKGNPPKTGSIESMKGLSDNFKIIFMRTHSPDQDVTAAEGYIRPAHLATNVSVKGIPPAFDAKLKGNKINWTPLQNSGWVSLTITPKASASDSRSLFKINNLFGGIFAAFAANDDSTQMWIDPKAGTTGTLDSSLFDDTDILIAFIGTTVDLPAPTDGADNSAFLDAASESG